MNGFFFFQQKTAYDLRISDWSSDVCSSDLLHSCGASRSPPAPARRLQCESNAAARHRAQPCVQTIASISPSIRAHHSREGGNSDDPNHRLGPAPAEHQLGQRPHRSEEHTSELQSLMRISYAVFCLQKKTKQNHTTQQQHIT